ncbi:50S ribosomal protein L29 [bacterium (Candidatus Torokbacteria) CG_4_10_14_0_2_um_filter_35_8]|nr:MAG: 50S ribosomal protein L29 [bacterium (Candidatus Torokbacteria) CG_4_10_14_0_2_um_filter_35_8]
MNIKELKHKKKKELIILLSEKEENLYKLRFEKEMGASDKDTNAIKKARKDIARIKTLLSSISRDKGQNKEKKNLRKK